MDIEYSQRIAGGKPNRIAGKVGCAAICLLMLSGCSGQTTRYILIDGNLTQRSAEFSDWSITAGGKQSKLVGNVSARVGVERDGYSAYAGINHYSLANYGHDMGYNGIMLGISKRVEF